jgi:PleD family two-component response regulator
MDNRKKILAVDDNKVNRLLLTEIFNSEYDVLTAENGKEALEILEKSVEGISLVFWIWNAYMNGYEFLEEMRKNPELEKIPVIVVTSKDDADTEVKAIDMGADEVIIKPIHPKVIQKRARNIILKTELQEIMLRRDSLTGMYKSEVFYHRTREMIKNDLENSFVVACLNVGKLSWLMKFLVEKREMKYNYHSR